MQTMIRHTTLVQRVWPWAEDANLVRNLVLLFGGAMVIALAGQVGVPMEPIPMTLQSLAVLIVGAAYGPRLGAITVLLYACAAAIGLPVLAGGRGGVGELVGPMGGYIAGFVLAAFVVGTLAERGWDRSMRKTLVAMFGGAAVIYVPGLIWLALWLGPFGSQPAADPMQLALAQGFEPFVLSDAVKAVVAALGIPAMWGFLGGKSR
jgi:biotin transport system substrate-specific component